MGCDVWVVPHHPPWVDAVFVGVLVVVRTGDFVSSSCSVLNLSCMLTSCSALPPACDRHSPNEAVLQDSGLWSYECKLFSLYITWSQIFYDSNRKWTEHKRATQAPASPGLHCSLSIRMYCMITEGPDSLSSKSASQDMF